VNYGYENPILNSFNRMNPYNGYQQPQPTPQMYNPNSRKWVQGLAGAKSYLVAPNQTVDLWDSESQTIYVKSADASGLPTLKVLDYTLRDNGSNLVENNALNNEREFVSINDFKALESKLTTLENELMSLKAPKHDKKVNNLVKGDK